MGGLNAGKSGGVGAQVWAGPEPPLLTRNPRPGTPRLPHLATERASGSNVPVSVHSAVPLS
jgi:hypothetical protein